MAKRTSSRAPSIGGTTEPGVNSMLDIPGILPFGKEFPTISMQCFNGKMVDRTSSKETNTTLLMTTE